MDLFKLVGSIFINNQDANDQIDQTKEKGQNMAQKLGKALSDAGDKIEKAGKKVGDFANKLAPLSAITGAVLGASVKGASDFTDGMAKMSTLFDTTQTDVGDLSQKFLDLSTNLNLGATELAEAGYQALSAGIDVNDSAGFVETAGKLAKAGFTQTATAVDVLTTMINAYGLSADEAEALSNKLVRTQNLGKTTVDELASSMGKIIPTASSMNVNVDNLTSGYVALTKQGIATAESTTYMNSMLNELGDSGTDLGGILKEQTGMSFQELMSNGYSLADVLKITKDYADENGIAYNELWGSAEAGKAGIAILNGGIEEFNSTVETMASDTDDVSDALEKLNTPSEQAKKALNELKNIGIELGQTALTMLVPVLSKVRDVIKTLHDRFNGLSEGQKKTIVTILAVITAIAPVGVVIGKIISIVGTLISSIGTIISVIGAVVGVLGAPLTIILAIGGALVYLWKTNENFRNKVIEIWTAVKEKTIEVATAIKEYVTEKFESIKEGVSNILTSMSEFISSAWETIKNVFIVVGMFLVELITLWFDLITLPWRFIWENCKDIIIPIFEAIREFISTAMDTIRSVIETVLTAVSEFFSTVWNAIYSVVSTIITAVWTFISNVMNTILSVITSILNAIKLKFTTIWNAIKTTVSNVIDGVKTKISDGLESAKSTVTEKLNAIKQKFTDIFDKCKTVVHDAIEYIKGLFNFEWKLPDLKLPHFSISGGFSLNPPSAPSFGVEWYKKAMDNPMMFTSPTIFGVNGHGQPMGAGEAGDEVMIGRNTMMNMISDAVSAQNNGVIDALYTLFGKLFDLLSDYSPEEFRKAMSEMGIKVNNREFARLVKAVE